MLVREIKQLREIKFHDPNLVQILVSQTQEKMLPRGAYLCWDPLSFNKPDIC